MSKETATVLEQLQAHLGSLTRAERQLADTLLDNYPISGLGSITELAEAAQVSTPTVARMVQKIGFTGYPQFQVALRQELQAMVSDPARKHDSWRKDIPQEHMLMRFASAVTENLHRSLDQIDLEAFDAFCAQLANPAMRIHICGGRISATVAQYLFLHLQMVRPDVSLVPTHSNVWPHYMLDIGENDLLIAFDVRRYENSTLMMAEMAHERGAEIALMTDQWRSPIHRLARHTFAARIAVPSAWDSAVSMLFLVEAAIAAVQEAHWDTVKSRTEALEAAFDRSGLFRKFV